MVHIRIDPIGVIAVIEPKPNVVHLPVYQPGKPIEDVKRELGLAEVIKLASNENPFGCSPAVKAAIEEELANVGLYPDGAAKELRTALADHLGVGEDQLIFGAGADEVILMIARAYLRPGDETVMARDTFGQYKHNAEVEGATVVEVPLRDGKHDLQAMLDEVTEKTRIVWICNPNNPTGTIVTHKEVEAFLARVGEDVMVVLDEAYSEYVTTADYHNGLALLAEYPNLVLLRTFSKIYGLASLRIGYGIGHPDVIRGINQVRPPFNTTRVAQKAAIAALADQDFIRRCREANAEGLRYFADQFRRLGLNAYPAYGNFIMVDTGKPSSEVFDGLLRRGYIVRAGHQLGNFPTHIRVTVGSREQNEGLVAALEEVLQSLQVKV